MIARFIVALLFLAAAVAWCADEVGDAALIRKWVAQLDDDRFAVRETAKAELLKVGAPAISQLIEAGKSQSAEQRARARQVLGTIRARGIARGFAELGKRADEDIDVELGMCLIAQMRDPGVTPEAIGAKLDAMAAAVRKSIGKGVDPKSLPGKELMAALTGVLKGKYGLEGDTENYNHPDNSSIHRVIEQKNGLPILLSEIAVAVARRLDVPIVGIPVPGRYMIKYDGAQAPKGKPRDDVIVDPYGGWVVTTAQEINRVNFQFDPQEDVLPSAPRATLERMLNNLESDFEAVGDLGQAAAVRRLRALLVSSARPGVGGALKR